MMTQQDYEDEERGPLVEVPEGLVESIIDPALEDDCVPDCPDWMAPTEIKFFKAGSLLVPYRPGAGPIVE